MSQREKAGANAARFSVGAGDEVEVGPGAVFACASSDTCLPLAMRRSAASGVEYLHFSSDALGVAHPLTSCACLGNWSSLVLVEPSGFVAVVAMPGVSFQSRLEGVTQPLTGIAFAASAGNAPPAWFGPPFDPSVALGVFQPAVWTWLRRMFGSRFCSDGDSVACFASCTVGVPQPATNATVLRLLSVLPAGL
jgi:hypothetical protein